MIDYKVGFESVQSYDTDAGGVLTPALVGLPNPLTGLLDDRFVNRILLLTLSLVFVLAGQSGRAAGPNAIVTGSTLFPELTGADVTLHVGSGQFAAVTDAQGDYSLEIPTPGADELIHLEIQGTGSQDHLRYARVVGQWADLETGVPSVDLGPASPLSSVLYVLVEARAGGSLPAAFSAVEPLAHSVETDDIESMMLVLAAVEQGLVQLDPGVANTLDMLRDPQAVLMLIEDTGDNQESWDQAQAAFRQQFEEARLYRPRGGIPDRLETIAAEVYSSQRTLIDLENGADAWLGHRNYGGRIVLETEVVDVIWSDRFALGGPANAQGGMEHREWTFRPAPGADVVMYAGQVLYEPGGEVVPYRDELFRLTWRTLDASTSFPLADTAIDRTRFYPENPELPPEGISRDIPNDIAMALRPEHLPATWQGPQAGDTWSLPLCAYDFDHKGAPAYRGPFGYDFVTFNGEGTATTRRAPLENLQWTLQDGLLTLTADNAPRVELRYVGDTTHDALVAATCRQASGNPRTLAGHAAQVESVADFAQLDLPMRFVSGFGLDGYLPRFFNAPGVENSLSVEYWVIELYADGTGKAGELHDPFDTDVSPDTYTLEWSQLPNGRVEIFKEHTFFGDSVAQSRSWLPIATEGDDLLFIESLVLATQAELDGELSQPGRYNWYRMVDLPPAP